MLFENMATWHYEGIGRRGQGDQPEDIRESKGQTVYNDYVIQFGARPAQCQPDEPDCGICSAVMEFFQQTYTALRGPTGVPQTPADTITRLSDRLSPSTLLADRRAAVLSLKGLARAHKQLVSDHALQGLLGIIQNDADVDPDIGRAAIETVVILCDTVDDSYTQRDLGLEHTDKLLEDEKTAHKLFALLGDQDHLLRHSACVLLITVLQNRPQKVQAYFLKAPVGPSPVIALLEGEKDIVGQGKRFCPALYHVLLPTMQPFVRPIRFFISIG
jgi:hypothetical protein